MAVQQAQQPAQPASTPAPVPQTAPKQVKPPEKKSAWPIIAIVITLLLVGGIVTAFTFRGRILSAVNNLFPTKTEQAGEVADTAVASPTPSPEATGPGDEGPDYGRDPDVGDGTVVDEDELIWAAVIKSEGFGQAVDVSVTENTGMHARGGVTTDIGRGVYGGDFIAAKVEGEWMVVYYGLSHPTCEQLEPYNFPLSMVEECLDANGDVVPISKL